MTTKIFRWDAKVRDYELDSQGIVNNANYLNYFEQCRNDFGRHMGIDFIEYYQRGLSFVVASVTIDYLRSLRANDQFYVTAVVSGCDDKRIHFAQEVHRSDNDKLVAKAMVHVACVDQRSGRAVMPEDLSQSLNLFTT